MEQSSGRSSTLPSFACGMCGKCFSDADQCRLHIQSHTGQQPFRCIICWPLFYDMSSSLPPGPSPRTGSTAQQAEGGTSSMEFSGMQEGTTAKGPHKVTHVGETQYGTHQNENQKGRSVTEALGKNMDGAIKETLGTSGVKVAPIPKGSPALSSGLLTGKTPHDSGGNTAHSTATFRSSVAAEVGSQVNVEASPSHQPSSEDLSSCSDTPQSHLLGSGATYQDPPFDQTLPVTACRFSDPSYLSSSSGEQRPSSVHSNDESHSRKGRRRKGKPKRLVGDVLVPPYPSQEAAVCSDHLYNSKPSENIAEFGSEQRAVGIPAATSENDESETDNSQLKIAFQEGVTQETLARENPPAKTHGKEACPRETEEADASIQKTVHSEISNADPQQIIPQRAQIKTSQTILSNDANSKVPVSFEGVIRFLKNFPVSGPSKTSKVTAAGVHKSGDKTETASPANPHSITVTSNDEGILLDQVSPELSSSSGVVLSAEPAQSSHRQGRPPEVAKKNVSVEVCTWTEETAVHTEKADRRNTLGSSPVVSSTTVVAAATTSVLANSSSERAGVVLPVGGSTLSGGATPLSTTSPASTTANESKSNHRCSPKGLTEENIVGDSTISHLSQNQPYVALTRIHESVMKELQSGRSVNLHACVQQNGYEVLSSGGSNCSSVRVVSQDSSKGFDEETIGYSELTDCDRVVLYSDNDNMPEPTLSSPKRKNLVSSKQTKPASTSKQSSRAKKGQDVWRRETLPVQAPTMPKLLRTRNRTVGHSLQPKPAHRDTMSLRDPTKVAGEEIQQPPKTKEGCQSADHAVTTNASAVDHDKSERYLQKKHKKCSQTSKISETPDKMSSSLIFTPSVAESVKRAERKRKPVMHTSPSSDLETIAAETTTAKTGESLAENVLSEIRPTEANSSVPVAAVDASSGQAKTSLHCNNSNTTGVRHFSYGKFSLFVCDKCGARFRKHANYLLHKDNKCRGRFHCEVCEKSFGRRESLKSHMRFHTGEAAMDCTVCGKTLSNPQSLSIHMLTHTGEKPYSCPECPKTFRQQPTLTQHYRTHTKDKPYKCNICGKCYRFHKNLYNHKFTHTGERRFVCHICNAAYFQVGALRVHMKVHTGERPHACHLCNMSFVQKAHLHKHMRHRHKDRQTIREENEAKSAGKPYKCCRCGRGFTSLFSQRRHSRHFCVALFPFSDVQETN